MYIDINIVSITINDKNNKDKTGDCKKGRLHLHSSQINLISIVLSSSAPLSPSALLLLC